MKLKKRIRCVFGALLALTTHVQAENQWLDEYNVVWDSQSKNSSESMPCGGGDIGLNVWVEKGDLLFYIDRSGNIDENDQQRKSGRVRIQMDPSPFSENPPSSNSGVTSRKYISFKQELDLKTGAVLISGKTADNKANIKIWVEVKRPIIHVELNSEKSSVITAAFESWRAEKQLIPRTEQKGRDYNRWASYGYCHYSGEVYSYADSLSFTNNNAVLFYHRNSDDLYFDKVVKQQGLDKFSDRLVHPQRDRIFGGMMRGKNLKPANFVEGKYVGTPFEAWRLKSVKPTKEHAVQIVLHTKQTPSLTEWKENLQMLADENVGADEAWSRNQKWWTEFWNRSHIVINKGKGPDDAGWQVGRNYQLMRYVLGCNAYGEWPTRFNGGLFTFDPKFVSFNWFFKQKDKVRQPSWFNPDYRAWGAWTAQNQRLVYWPMLKSGDFEMMRPQFEYYRKNLPNAKLRNEAAWGIKGCSFSEQISSSGLPTGYHYGWWRKPGNEVGVAKQHTHYYATQLEFAYMIHEWYRFNGADISEYIPFLKDTVIFHFEYHKMLQRRRNGKDWGSDGKLVLSPGHACETYKGTNPASLLAALHKNLDCLLALPEKWVGKKERAQFTDWKQRTPDLDFRTRNGHKTIAPVKEAITKTVGIGNLEIPQLYPVYPFGMYALGLPDLDVAVNTWEYGMDHPRKGKYYAKRYGMDSYPQKISWWGWTQHVQMLARLGLTDEAKWYITRKLGDARGNTDWESKERMRFPTFWGPRFDWNPDMNWGGSGMIGLQEMCLQTIAKDGKEIRILPAWPKEWDVDFKLHAPDNTTVECTFKGGEISKQKILPSNRKVDVVIGQKIK